MTPARFRPSHAEPTISSEPTCHSVGISGGCGGGCPLLAVGRCETQAQMEPELPLEAQERLGRARVALAMDRRDR